MFLYHRKTLPFDNYHSQNRHLRLEVFYILLYVVLYYVYILQTCEFRQAVFCSKVF